jgi:glycosyltransferase involved in cell wall biosynthesis
MSRPEFSAEAGLRTLVRNVVRHPLTATRQLPTVIQAFRAAWIRRQTRLMYAYLSVGLPDETELWIGTSLDEKRLAHRILMSRRPETSRGTQSRLIQRALDLNSRAHNGPQRHKPHPLGPSDDATASRTLLYVAHDAITQRRNGYTMRTHALLRHLAEEGWSVHVLLRPRDAASYTETVDNVTYQHIGLPLSHWLSWQDYEILFAEQIAATGRDLSPIAIQAASNHLCAAAAARAATAVGLPFLYEVRGLWHVTREANDRNYRTSAGWLAQHNAEISAATRAHHVFALNTALADYLAEMGVSPSRMTLLPNAGYQPPRVSPRRNAESKGRLNIGYLGSLVSYEGLEILLEALASLSGDERQRINLDIHGTGPSEAALKSLAKSHDLDEQVIFHGAFNPAVTSVADLYANLDLVALPRRADPVTKLVCPLKPYEAAGYGCPLLVSDVAPLREFAEASRAAWLFPAGDVQALAAQLVRALHDPDGLAALSQNGLHHVATKASWRNRAMELSRVLTGLHPASGEKD